MTTELRKKSFNMVVNKCGLVGFELPTHHFIVLNKIGIIYIFSVLIQSI